tara:strand:- start:609 stop:740 length:132 start_codon:yes stop_codon:yes gene_type:complete
MGINVSKKQTKPFLPCIYLYEEGKKHVLATVTKEEEEWLRIFY